MSKTVWMGATRGVPAYSPLDQSWFRGPWLDSFEVSSGWSCSETTHGMISMIKI